MAIWLSIIVFLTVALAIVLFGYRRYVLAGQTYENLGASVMTPGSHEAPPNPDFFSITKLALAFAEKLPASPETASAIQVKMMTAGYRDQSAVAVMYGMKLLFTVAITG